MENNFAIIQGRYNNVDGVHSFDPEKPTCANWFMLIEKKYMKVLAGGDLEQCLKCASSMAKKFKTLDALHIYIQDQINEFPNYETPLYMKSLYSEAIDLYGDKYQDDLCRVLEAHTEAKKSKTNKAKIILRRKKKKRMVIVK